MAQLRPEVRPAVTSMPVEGFGMQTGGSARRRVVPFDSAMNSYKVTGVPGHTHNASAVCSVLVDNTERSNVPLIINDHFAYSQVNQVAPRYTDSAPVDESNYDRALERGIGEIAIVPENCHQEIREPARAISELRTLVMPKDRRDTLTYVEEVGGFVSQSTGAVPSPEPVYPDVVVDLFHSYELPVATHTVPGNGVAGTGNAARSVGELRFEADPPDEQWYRYDDPAEDDFGEGAGVSFVPFQLVDQPLATVHGKPWNGLVTLQWDPNAKLYFCPAFEATFTRVHESFWDANTVYRSQVHNNFEVAFPRIETTMSKDGQCLFSTRERPLIDAGDANTGYKTIECTVDQSNLLRSIDSSIVKLLVWPFRIATGYSSAIRGPGRGTNFWDRVRNATLVSTTDTVQRGGIANTDAYHALYINNGADPPVKDPNDHRRLQSEVADFFANRHFIFKPAASLPVIHTRNAIEGTSYSMLPVSLDMLGRVFGPVYGLQSDGADYDPDVNDAAVTKGFGFLNAAIQALYDANGHAANVNHNAAWVAAGNYTYGQRVGRRLDTDKLFMRMQDVDDAEAFVRLMVDPATALPRTFVEPGAPINNATITINLIDATTGIDIVPNQSVTVLYQSESHWEAVHTNLRNKETHANTVVRNANTALTAHENNLNSARNGEFPTQNVGNNDPPTEYGVPAPANDAAVAAAVAAVLPQILISLVDAREDREQARARLAQAQSNTSLHESGRNFVFGTTPADDKRSLFVLDDTRLQTTLTSSVIREVNQGPFAFALPCTVRYMFNDRMFSWYVNAAREAAPEDSTLSDIFWGTRGLGLSPDDTADYGDRLQQETASFVTFCEPEEFKDDGATTDIRFDVDMEPLLNLESVFQDFTEGATGAQWKDPANALVNQAASDRRDTEAGRQITVMSVGLIDALEEATNAKAKRTKFDVLVLNADYGSTCIARLAHSDTNALYAEQGNRPLMQVLGNREDVQPLNRDRLSVMTHRRSTAQPVVMTPRFIEHHNNLANSNVLQPAPNSTGANNVNQDILYIGNAHFAFPKNRVVFVITNDTGITHNGAASVPMDDNNRIPPSVFVFETKDCEPVLHFDEFYNFANVMTRVRNVRYYDQGTNRLLPVDKTYWALIMDDHQMGHALNRSWCTLYMPSFDFQDTYFNADPFANIIADSLQTGVVHRSLLRVSQHLCAPLLNPNRRIGCSAPLNYDSLHLPPELRDFRIELRDVDFSFLPGASSATLEALTLYEFNGGNQLAGTQQSLLYMPHFRSFSTTTTGQSFEMHIFSPYGNPSYITAYARSKVRPNEYVKQPLIKTLTISSGTTMKKSNTILEAREHELFHLTQRNVHPRAEYTRSSNQKRQVILLCAEDIGDMGIAEYQKEKRANFTLSGSLDVPATVTVLFIYNNRGLSISNLEIGVVRV